MVKVESNSLVNAICNEYDVRSYVYIKAEKTGYTCSLLAKVLEDGKAIVCVDKIVYILDVEEYEIKE